MCLPVHQQLCRNCPFNRLDVPVWCFMSGVLSHCWPAFCPCPVFSDLCLVAARAHSLPICLPNKLLWWLRLFLNCCLHCFDLCDTGEFAGMLWAAKGTLIYFYLCICICIKLQGGTRKFLCQGRAEYTACGSLLSLGKLNYWCANRRFLCVCLVFWSELHASSPKWQSTLNTTVSCGGSLETLYSWGIDTLCHVGSLSAIVSILIQFQTYPHVENAKIKVSKPDTENS